MLSLAFSRTARRSAVVAGLIASTVACSDEATAPRQSARVPSGISAVDNPDLMMLPVRPPVVDGIIKAGEYTGGVSLSFDASVPAGLISLPTRVRVQVTRDQTYLYLAMTYDRKSPIHPMDHIAYEFDNDNDGSREEGDDALSVYANGTPNVAQVAGDGHRYKTSTGSAIQRDNLDGGTIDGLVAWGAAGGGTKITYEIRQPLNSADNAHDFSIAPIFGSQTVGMQMMVALEKGPIGSLEFLRTHHPSFTTYCQLTVSNAKVTSVSCP